MAAQPRPGSCVCRWHVIREQAGKIETAVGLDPEPFPLLSQPWRILSPVASPFPSRRLKC